MNQIQKLINRIKESNLAEGDKDTLLKMLEQDKPDIFGCINAFVKIMGIGKDIIDFFT